MINSILKFFKNLWESYKGEDMAEPYNYSSICDLLEKNGFAYSYGSFSVGTIVYTYDNYIVEIEISFCNRGGAVYSAEKIRSVIKYNRVNGFALNVPSSVEELIGNLPLQKRKEFLYNLDLFV